MKSLSGFLILAALVIAPSPCSAADGDGSLDNASQEALNKTKELLKDPTKRKEALQKDPNGAKTDANVQQVAGSEANAEDMYSLSAEVMEQITKEAGGDSIKMEKLIGDALRNPGAFAEKFTPAQKAKLKQIAEKAPDPSPSSEKKKQP